MYTVFPFTEKWNTRVLREKIAEHVFHFVKNVVGFLKKYGAQNRTWSFCMLCRLSYSPHQDLR